MGTRKFEIIWKIIGVLKKIICTEKKKRNEKRIKFIIAL